MRGHRFLPFIFFILIFISLSSVRPVKVMAQSCGGPIPAKPLHIWATSGPSTGEVTLYWDEASYANRYAVAYGVERGKYIYGADNIGGEKDRKFTVNYLAPGKKYYFVIAAARDACSSPFSQEVSAVAMGGRKIVAVSQQIVSSKSVGLLAQATSDVAQVGKQRLWAASGPNIGEVTLHWQHADNADNYHLVYGREKDKFQYGALNIGKVDIFTVRGLTAGVTYYFALVPLVNNNPLYTTKQVRATAKMPVEIVEVEEEDLIQPEFKISAPPKTPRETTVEVPPSGFEDDGQLQVSPQVDEVNPPATLPPED